MDAVRWPIGPAKTKAQAMTRQFTAMLTTSALPFAIALAPAQAAAARDAPTVSPDAMNLAKACEGRDGWADAAPPARIFGNTYYVGTCGISVLLVTGNDGHILVDGGLAESAPKVLANISALGFDPRDVRWIVSSHEHFDHAAALAPLQRATGAKVAALPASASLLSSGKPNAEDPQFSLLEPFEPVRIERTIEDGQELKQGNLTLTVHATPAHSPGSTSWTWQSCNDQKRCVRIAYADSATAISADGYRFTRHPQRVADVRKGYKVIAALPCDLLVTPHPSASNLFDRLSGKAPLTDAAACQTYAANASAKFDARLAKEESGS